MKKLKINIHGYVPPREPTATGEAVLQHALEFLHERREKLERSVEVTRQERQKLIESISDKRLKQSAREG